MFTKRLVLRQIARSRKQAAIFVLCVLLSMVTLTALGGFGASVDRSMLNDARALHAGDLIIRSHYPFSAPLLSAITDLQRRNVARGARFYQFYSVVRVPAETRSLLADLKVVEPGYPLYGTVDLASRRPLHTVLTPGTCVVEATLLERLRLEVGHRLLVGRAALTIVDVVTREPDRPINLFALGPRILIGTADLEALNLIQDSSRAHYVYLLKVPEEGDLSQALAGLRHVADPEERIETFRTARSRIKRFFDNFLFFLNLISIFTLMLAGIGIQSSLLALLKENEKTIAIMKALGATSRFVRRHYLWVALALGTAGTLIGLGVGLALQQMLPRLFVGMIPPDVTFMISWRSIFEGLTLGMVAVTLFTFIPLQRLRDLKPNAIFRKEPVGWASGPLPYLSAMAMGLFFCGMVLWRLRELRLGLYFVGGVIGLILVAALATEAILRGLKRRRVKSLPLRQALKGLFRPRNATRPTIITLTTSLAVLFSIYLIERNLDAAFIQSYPADAPNLFFIDIQPAQVDPFSHTLGQQTEFYPIIRARLNAINGRAIDPKAERQRRGDNLAREFNLTYRDHLLEDEVLSKGSGLFHLDWDGPQVSVLDTVVKIRSMDIGDRLTFNIQGVPLEARIASIRSRTRESIRPFFYFVFENETLKAAPQTLFTAVSVPREQIGALQNRIVYRFPNISAIDMTATLGVFSRVMHKLSGIVRFFALFSTVAGMLIMVSSVFATRLARIREAVYYKILGAGRRFILSVFTLENVLLGLISALLALGISQAGSWVLTVRVLDIVYRPFWGASLLMLVGTVCLVAAVGLLASVSVLQQRPASFLNQHTEE